MLPLLPTDAEIASRHENGTPSVIELKRPHVIDGVACVHMVHLHENGRLAYCILAEPCAMGDFQLEANDSVYRRDDGTLERIHFDRPRTVGAHAEVGSIGFDDCGGAIKELVIGDATLDSSSGVIRSRRLAAAETIQGVPCEMLATFDEEGHLASAILAAPLVTSHGTLPAGSLVRFHADGSVDRAQLSGSCILAGQPFERNDPAHFRDGTVLKEGWVFYTPARED